MNDSVPRHSFLRDEFHGLTLQATVQRARIYAPGVSEPSRVPFQAGLRRALDTLAKRYTTSVDEQRHVENIARLADDLSTKHGSLLMAGRFRIGPAQKALNLFLKYLWCAGLVPTPPHCPFDRLVIQLFPPRDRANWTTLDSLDGYRGLVSAARRLAGTRSLAEWELVAYNEVSMAARRAT